MKISLNLATRPYTDHGPAIKQLRIGMGILAGILLLLGLGWVHFHQSAKEMAAKEAQIDRQVAQMQREQVGYRQQMQQPANARVLQQAQFLNTLFDEKGFSWTGAMEDLEQVLPAGVQVTAIDPSRGKDGRITLHLRVSGMRERAVEMLREMEHSKRFAMPRISGENTENSSQNTLQPVRDTAPAKVNFDILAEYNPATLAERQAATEAAKRTRAATATTQPGPHPAVPGRSMPAPRPNMPMQPQVQAPQLQQPQNPHMRPGQGELVRPRSQGPPPWAQPPNPPQKPEENPQ